MSIKFKIKVQELQVGIQAQVWIGFRLTTLAPRHLILKIDPPGVPIANCAYIPTSRAPISICHWCERRMAYDAKVTKARSTCVPVICAKLLATDSEPSSIIYRAERTGQRIRTTAIQSGLETMLRNSFKIKPQRAAENRIMALKY